MHLHLGGLLLLVYYALLPTTATRKRMLRSIDPQVDRAGLTLGSARFRTASATMHIVHA